MNMTEELRRNWNGGKMFLCVLDCNVRSRKEEDVKKLRKKNTLRQDIHFFGWDLNPASLEN
jgi:hypothetical protein